MKRTHILICILLVILLPVSTLAFQNEPTGFRGITWGADISKLADMKFLKDDGDMTFYQRKGEKLKLGDASLTDITYVAYKGRLERVLIRYEGFSNHQSNKRKLFELYGNPYKENGFLGRYSWFGTDVHIDLDYNEVIDEGNLSYCYKPLSAERESDVEAGSKAAADHL